MAFFSKEELSTKNNTLLVITVIIILSFAMYVLFVNDDLMGILISLLLVITCGVITILMIN